MVAAGKPPIVGFCEFFVTTKLRENALFTPVSEVLNVLPLLSHDE